MRSRLGRVPGLRQAARRRHRQRLRGGLAGSQQSRACTTAVARVIGRYEQPALVERYLPGREFTVGIVGNGEDARVLGVCEILLKAECRGQCLLAPQQGAVRGAGHLRAGRRRRGAAGGNARAGNLSGARMPRRGADRFSLRRNGRALFPRGQSSCRAQSLAFRPADPCRAERHRLRDADRHDPRCRLGPLRAQPRPGPRQRGNAPDARARQASSRSCMPRPTAAPTRSTTIVAAEAVSASLVGSAMPPRSSGLLPISGGSTSARRADRCSCSIWSMRCGGNGRLAPMVPARLDALGLPYTGAHTGAWLDTLSKVETKLKLERCRPADAGLVGGRVGARSRSPLHRQAGVGAWLVRHRPANRWCVAPTPRAPS